MSRTVRFAFLFAVSLLVSGCKEVLHSALQELEANEIVAVLYSKGIESTKAPLKGGLYSVSVPQSEFGAAVAILATAGLPRQPFQSVGELFPDDNVVGTPFEERVRFAYALSQELSRTLTEVSGVHYARVHIVIPERGRFDEAEPPAKAALAIYYKSGFDPAEHLPQMKNLVAFAVPNLSYDDVSISLFPAGGVFDVVAGPQAEPIAANANSRTASVTEGSVRGDMIALALLAILLLACVAIARQLVFAVRRAFGKRVVHDS